METTFNIKAQIFIWTTVSVLIVYGQVNIMNGLQCVEQWICETFHSLLFGKINNLL